MSSTFGYNGVRENIELRKRLRRDSVILFDENKRVDVNLLCSSVKLGPDVEHLHLQWS